MLAGKVSGFANCPSGMPHYKISPLDIQQSRAASHRNHINQFDDAMAPFLISNSIIQFRLQILSLDAQYYLSWTYVSVLLIYVRPI